MARATIKVIRSPKSEEAAAGVRLLVTAGYDVDDRPITGPADVKRLRVTPPAAFVIDLHRAPSFGRDLAVGLRQHSATRGVPIVFVAGEPSAVARTKRLLPDAEYATWRRVRGALTRVLRQPPTEPVRPASAMAGYSGTPLPKKLGIKAGSRVVLTGAPQGFARMLEPLPDAATVKTINRGARDVTLWFTRSRRELERGIDTMAAAVGETRLWIVWPKKTSALAGDHSERDVRRVGLAAGLVDFKICAVDREWSGLAFVRRKRT